jgi:hypothetical protein
LNWHIALGTNKTSNSASGGFRSAIPNEGNNFTGMKNKDGLILE